MGFRKFLVYATIYVALVWIVVYSLFPDNASISILDYSISLPVSVWVAGVVGLLGIFAILHIAYYGFLVFKFKHDIKKDEKSYKDLGREILLANEINPNFKTGTFKVASGLTRYLSPWQRGDDKQINDDELLGLAQTIQSVKNGEVADLKRFRLDKENPLNIANKINKINKLPDYYLDVLKNPQSHAKAVEDAAYNKLIECADYANIRKYFISSRSIEDEMAIISRFEKDEIKLNADEVYEIINDQRMSSKEFIKMAMMLSHKLSPDACLNIFEKLREAHLQAESAYLYVLFELSMIDQAREILQNSAADEFSEFKTLLFLRDHSKAVPTCLFFK